MSIEKPKVAFFSFTCCEGCQLMVLSCERELPAMLDAIDIVKFREAMSSTDGSRFDIAFIEGSISKEREIEKLRKIRERTDTLVALGACSSIGGINCLKNRFPMDEARKIVYGKDALDYEATTTLPVTPIDSIVKVDYYIHGCPITKDDFLSFIKAVLMGKTPLVVNHPVCVDCKMAGNICVFERGMTCVGPVTRGGCKAICVTYGCVCWGCRGYVDDPNINAHGETLKRYGQTIEGVQKTFGLYGACRAKG